MQTETVRRIVSVQVPVYVASDVDPEDATATELAFRTLVEVSIADAAKGNVTLYAEDANSGTRFPIALYNTFDKAPMFRRYSLSGIRPDQPVEILAEVRIDPLPLQSANDVLPFDCIEPIEWMINYDWCMKSGEVDKAQKYKTEALNWLKSKEVVNDTVQTSIVVNSQMPGSLGEDSMMAVNI